MKHFRKCWDDEKHRFLLDHKDMDRKELYGLFCRTFERTDISFCAVMNERSRIGAAPKRPHGSTRQRPLYSEQEKKGYIRIKVAQPNVWIMKARWVYEETHPGYIYSKNDVFYFLDGDSRNFSPDNIEVMKRQWQTLFQQFGGTVEDNPELTRLHILQAGLKYKTFDFAEKNGLTSRFKNFRRMKEDARKKTREYWNRKTKEEQREISRRYRERLAERMEADPVFAEKIRKQHRGAVNRYNNKKKGRV